MTNVPRGVMLLALLLLAAPALAAPQRLAVLELRGEFPQAVLATWTDQLREGALRATRGSSLEVMTRENTAVVARDMGLDLDCAEVSAECEIDIGRNIGADLLFSGSVVQMGATLVATVKLHHTERGVLLSSRTARGADEVQLLDTLAGIAERMVREDAGDAGEPAPQRTEVPPSVRERAAETRPETARREPRRPPPDERVGPAAEAERPEDSMQPGPGFEVGVWGAFYKFESNRENLTDSGRLGLSVGLRLDDVFGLDLTLSYVPTATIHGDRVSHYVTFGPEVLLQPPPFPVRPFAVVGFGLRGTHISESYASGAAPEACDWKRDPYLTEGEITASQGANSECRLTWGHLRYAAEHVEFLATLGGGARFSVRPGFGFRLDFRYVLTHGPAGGDPGDESGVPVVLDDDGDGESDLLWQNTFHHVSLGGGVYILFGPDGLTGARSAW